MELKNYIRNLIDNEMTTDELLSTVSSIVEDIKKEQEEAKTAREQKEWLKIKKIYNDAKREFIEAARVYIKAMYAFYGIKNTSDDEEISRQIYQQIKELEKSMQEIAKLYKIGISLQEATKDKDDNFEYWTEALKNFAKQF